MKIYVKPYCSDYRAYTYLSTGEKVEGISGQTPADAVGALIYHERSKLGITLRITKKRAKKDRNPLADLLNGSKPEV